MIDFEKLKSREKLALCEKCEGSQELVCCFWVCCRCGNSNLSDGVFLPGMMMLMEMMMMLLRIDQQGDMGSRLKLLTEPHTETLKTWWLQ